jgi:DNA-binding NtrC family response regulator
MTPEAMDLIMKHDWPGNVRELHNAVERLVAMAQTPLLLVDDLPSTVQRQGAGYPSQQAAAAIAGARNSNSTGPKVILPLHEVEKRAIIEALEQTRGDRTLAAMMLGIGRTTLYRKLKEYQLPDGT